MDIVSTASQNTTGQIPTPKRILATLQAYRDAAALNTAIELDLFTRIAHGTDTASKIAAELAVPVRGIRLLCEYLAGAGLLEKEDEQLKLSEDVALFLDKKSSSYLGSTVGVLYSSALLHGYERLTESVRAGRAGEPDATTRPEWFDVARGMTGPGAAAKPFAEAVTFPAGQPVKILDIAARDGAFGIALGVRYADSVIVALDCPEALKAAQENAEAAKLGTRYQNIPGDPLLAPLGREYDAVLIADSLYQFDESQITSLMMRIHYALKKTGQLYILEFLSEDSPEFRREFAGMRLNMLAATSKGDAYSLADLKGMLEASGFRGVEAQPLAAARATLVTARP
jgi:ubiquinone/menaquinone biosynthesis C-methylase UbiE